MGMDSLVAGRRESGAIWHEDDGGNYVRVDSGDVPRTFKEGTFVGIKGLGCVTYPEIIRAGRLYDGNVGIYPIDDPLAWLEVRDDDVARLASQMLAYTDGRHPVPTAKDAEG
jgi:hypothetical protein